MLSLPTMLEIKPLTKHCKIDLMFLLVIGLCFHCAKE